MTRTFTVATDRCRPRRALLCGRGAAAMAFLALIAAGALACADFEAPEDPTFGLPDELLESPSFSTDIAPIFERRCATGGCHSPATHQAALQLAPASAAYDQTVNAGAVLKIGMDRIEPGDPDQSWLVRMIEDDPARRDGHPRMPLASRPLTPNQIANIRRWIEQGALEN